MAVRVVRSAQRRSGVTIRTRKGTPVFPEDAKQNYVGFGVQNAGAGAGGTLLGNPGAGFCWVIESLVVTCAAYGGNGLQVNFTGGIGVTFQTTSTTAAVPAQLIQAPFALGSNVSFGYSSGLIGSGTAPFSISGSAYKATIASITNPAPAQLVAPTIDSDPATDLG